jgi:hypothetical protein
MIRRTCAILALAAATALTLAAPASANHTLAHKVQLLTAKLNCLQKYPVFAFGDYAYYELGNASVEVLDTQTPTPQPVQVLLDNDEITALDFNYGTGAPPSDAFFLGVKNTTTCRSKFPTAPNPVSFARVATTAKMLRLQ